jgi:hypothetical protein
MKIVQFNNNCNGLLWEQTEPMFQMVYLISFLVVV